jgi:hypothetical protein
MAGIGWAPLGGEWWTWRWCPFELPAWRHAGRLDAWVFAGWIGIWSDAAYFSCSEQQNKPARHLTQPARSGGPVDFPRQAPREVRGGLLTSKCCHSRTRNRPERKCSGGAAIPHVPHA